LVSDVRVFKIIILGLGFQHKITNTQMTVWCTVFYTWK